MKFGVRDIVDVVFKAKEKMDIGTMSFAKGQPVFYMDTATASTLEQATTTVYAQGGKGNTRLVSWEGEKTLTFTVTDALISPVSLSILSGAGLFTNILSGSTAQNVHVHTTATGTVDVAGTDRTITIADSYIDEKAPIYVLTMDDGGDITGTILEVSSVSGTTITLSSSGTNSSAVTDGTPVFIDYYESRSSANVQEIDITAESFGGNFYVEANTLFRDEDGKDYPAVITLPNVKVQSNFTFSMSASGDPSTFDFTMDAMPGYTMFDSSTKVMCVIQTINDAASGSSKQTNPVMLHDSTDSESASYQTKDSYTAKTTS